MSLTYQSSVWLSIFQSLTISCLDLVTPDLGTLTMWVTRLTGYLVAVIPCQPSIKTEQVKQLKECLFTRSLSQTSCLKSFYVGHDYCRKFSKDWDTFSSFCLIGLNQLDKKCLKVRQALETWKLWKLENFENIKNDPWDMLNNFCCSEKLESLFGPQITCECS